jgi:hypothetical protein
MAGYHTIDIRMKLKTGIRAKLAYWFIVLMPYKPLQLWLFRRLLNTVVDYEIVKG